MIVEGQCFDGNTETNSLTLTVPMAQQLRTVPENVRNLIIILNIHFEILNKLLNLFNVIIL